jgi:hypothetical protein
MPGSVAFELCPLRLLGLLAAKRNGLRRFFLGPLLSCGRRAPMRGNHVRMGMIMLVEGKRCSLQATMD